MLGLFFSSTNASHEAIRLDACLGGGELIEPLARYVAQTWTRRTYDDDYVNQLMITDEEVSGGTATASLTNRRLLGRIRAYVRYESSDRRFSDDVFTAGLAAQKHLLRGLFTADATVINGNLELTSDSFGLLRDVQLVLLGFGIQCAIFDVGEGGAVARGTVAAACGGGDSAVLGGAPGRQSENLPTAAPNADAVSRRHGLRIDPGSLRMFAKYVGLLPGKKRSTAQLSRRVAPRPTAGISTASLP